MMSCRQGRRCELLEIITQFLVFTLLLLYGAEPDDRIDGYAGHPQDRLIYKNVSCSMYDVKGRLYPSNYIMAATRLW